MPPVGGRQPYSISIRDYSGETQSIRLYTGEITAVSLPGLLTALGDFKTALDAVILGVIAKDHWGEETVITNSRAATKDAQVESELLVRCKSDVDEAPFSFRIPCIDYTAFNYADPPAGDQVILSGAGATAATIALVAQIENTFKMPGDETAGLAVVGMEVVR